MNSQRKGFLILFFRGVLGGLIGGFVFGAVEVCLLRPTGWDNWLGYFILISVVGGLPFSMIVGPALSIGIWYFYRETGIHVGLIPRAIGGTLVGMGAVLIAWSIASQHHLAPLNDLLGAVALGGAFGGIPGIVIGAQRAKAN